MVASVGELGTFEERRAAMNEDELHLDVPRWVYPLAVVTQLFTALAAGYVYVGSLITFPVIAAGTAALLLWLSTSYRDPRRRTFLPRYFLLVVLLLLQGLEQWHFGYAATLHRLFPESFAAPVVFDERIQLAIFTFAAVSLYLIGAVGLFFHHPLGNYMAWLLVCEAAVGGLTLLAMSLFAGRFQYIPGMACGTVAVVLGILGALRLARSPSRETP
jgi:hypothetical protein